MRITNLKFAVIGLLVVLVASSVPVAAQGPRVQPVFEVNIQGDAFRRAWDGRAAWNNDETQLLIWGDMLSASVYDVATETPILTLPHIDPADSDPNPNAYFTGVIAAAWSPDETLIATAGTDDRVKLWDAASGDLLYTWSLSAESPSTVETVDPFQYISLLWQPDSQRLLAAHRLRSDVVAWDSVTGTEAFRLSHPGPVMGMAFSPDHSRLLTWGMPMSDADLNEAVRAALAEVTLTDFADTRQFMADLGITASAYVWDAASGALLVELPQAELLILSATWKDDGTQIMTWSGIDPTADYIGAVIGALWEALGTSDLDSFYQSLDLPYAVRVWNAATGTPDVEIAEPGMIDLAMWSPDQTQIVTTNINRSLSIWDAATGELLHTFLRSPGLQQLAWSHDSQALHLLEAIECDASLCDYTWTWLTITTETRDEHAVQGDSAQFRVWNDQMTLAAWGADTVFVYNAAGDRLARLSNYSTTMTMQWNAAGDHLLRVGHGGDIRIWDLRALLTE